MDNSKTEYDALLAMSRLAEVANNTPRTFRLGDREYKITALKMGTQWLIAEKSAKILKAEKGNMNDIIKQFAINVPTVVEILALAILNDKEKIFNKGNEYSDEFSELKEFIIWKTNSDEWISLVVEVLDMLSLEYFFDITNAIAKIREMALEKKMTRKERESLLAAQNTDK